MVASSNDDRRSLCSRLLELKLCTTPQLWMNPPPPKDEAAVYAVRNKLLRVWSKKRSGQLWRVGMKRRANPRILRPEWKQIKWARAMNPLAKLCHQRGQSNHRTVQSFAKMESQNWSECQKERPYLFFAEFRLLPWSPQRDPNDRQWQQEPINRFQKTDFRLFGRANDQLMNWLIVPALPQIWPPSNFCNPHCFLKGVGLSRNWWCPRQMGSTTVTKPTDFGLTLLLSKNRTGLQKLRGHHSARSSSCSVLIVSGRHNLQIPIFAF